MKLKKVFKYIISFVYCILFIFIGFYIFKDGTQSAHILFNKSENTLNFLIIFLYNMRTFILLIVLGLTGIVGLLFISKELMDIGRGIDILSRTYHTSPEKILLGLIPHGIFEIICFSLVIYISFKFTYLWFSYLILDKIQSIKYYYKEYISKNLVFMLLLMSALLFCGAFIERYISRVYFERLFFN